VLLVARQKLKTCLSFDDDDDDDDDDDGHEDEVKFNQKTLLRSDRSKAHHHHHFWLAPHECVAPVRRHGHPAASVVAGPEPC